MRVLRLDTGEKQWARISAANCTPIIIGVQFAALMRAHCFSPVSKRNTRTFAQKYQLVVASQQPRVGTFVQKCTYQDLRP